MRRISLMLGVIAAMLAGCGGGIDVAGGGSSGTGISSGSASGFGSIIVNGVRYDVSTATITADGREVAETDLQVGMVVGLEGHGSGSERVATRVVYDSELRGLVERVDAQNEVVVVFGQTVRVDGYTVWKGVDLSRLQPGDLIEVSGRFQSDGRLRATFVSLKNGLAAGESYKVTGYLRALEASRFQLGALSIDYSDASLSAALHEAMLVKVEAMQPPSGGVLDATAVKAAEDRIIAEPGTDVELEGRVTRLASASQFYLNGQPVRLTVDTVYENGAASDIVLDAALEVEGRLNSAGELVAGRIIFRPEIRLAIEGAVEKVDASQGTVTVLGLTLRTTATTIFVDGSDIQLHRFGLADISVGNWLAVRGYPDHSGTPVASFIERRQPDAIFRLQGMVEAISLPKSLVVQGVEVFISDATEFDGALLDGLMLGDEVEISGYLDEAGVLRATLIKLHDRL